MSELETKPARIEIEGPDGLALKQLAEEDAQAYFDALHHDPARFQHGEERTLDKYQTVEDVRVSIEDPDPNRVRFGIWDGNTMVGTVNLQFNRPRSAELGYWSGYGGHDYSERGARLLVGYAFANYDIDKLTAWAAIGNKGSQLVLNRLGFIQQTSGQDQIFYELVKPQEQPANT